MDTRGEKTDTSKQVLKGRQRVQEEDWGGYTISRREKEGRARTSEGKRV